MIINAKRLTERYCNPVQERYVAGVGIRNRVIVGVITSEAKILFSHKLRFLCQSERAFHDG